MQCRGQPVSAGGAPGPLWRGRACRQLAVGAQAKLKYTIAAAQNHKRKTVWVNIDYNKLYTDTSYNPGRQVGPIKLQQLPGKGRGLVAEREVPLAETLLVCEPVGAAVTGPEGTDLLPPALAEELERMQAAGRLGPADRARLRLLHDGSAADSPTSLRNRSATLADFRKIEDKLRRAADAPKKPKGRGFGTPPPAPAPAVPAIDTAALGEAPLSMEELQQLTNLNSWGNAASDAGAAALRSEPSEAIIGVWPEFALMNHSCVPNTVVMAVGQLLLVQAARDIPAGSELTTSYLSDLSLAPLEWRRKWLAGSYGFECGCERCKAESTVPEAVANAVSAAYELSQREDAQELARPPVGRLKRDEVAQLGADLEAAVGRLESAMEEAALEDKLRTWLRASAYDAYRARAMIRDLPDVSAGAGLAGSLAGLFGGGPAGGGAGAPFSDPEAPRELARLMEAVAPGADVHLYLSVEALTRSAEAHGRDDPRVGQATKACLRAHILRYGRVSDAVIRLLIEARLKTKHYLGRVILTPRQGNGQDDSQDDGQGALTRPLLGSATDMASAAQLRQAAEELAASTM